MSRLCPLLFFLGSLLLPLAARAQLDDSFADGDFTSDPSWRGETNLWTVVPFRDDFALRSDGPAASDTLHLATASEVSFGSWSLAVAYDAGLSNFNKVRVYLLADQADLEGDVSGYYLELGTNDRDVVLYRSDPDRAAGRVELAASAEDVLPAEADTLELTVVRTDEGVWRVQLDGAELFTYEEIEPAVTTSSFFGVWVKHSSTRNRSYYFNEVLVSGGTSIPDATPPEIASASYADGLPGFQIEFSEEIDFATVDRSDFTISGGVGEPVSVQPESGTDTTRSVTLQVPAPLDSDTYDVDAGNLADLAGNILHDTTVSVVIEVDDAAPSIATVEATADDTVQVAFSEPVDPEEACRPSTYSISGDIGTPNDVACLTGIPGQPLVEHTALLLDQPLVAGQTYTLTVRGLTDARGNMRDEATAAFVYVKEGAVPEPGQIVVNEFNHRAFGADLEYVELFNLTTRSFDLRDFSFTDATRNLARLADETRYLLPDGYVVLVRDSAAFAGRFPDVDFVEPSNWPALNNSGDEIVLLYDEALTVDSLAYSSSWGGSDAALERIDPNGPSSVAANWGPSTTPQGGSPGERNSIYAVDTTPPALISATPNHAGDSLRAVFSELLDPATVSSTDFTSGPASPGVKSAIVQDEVVRLALNSTLSTGDYTLTVTGVADYSGNVLESNQVAFIFFRGDEAEARDVVINEVYYDTPTRGEPEEYVELLNVSQKTFDLSEFAFADEESEPVPLADVSRPLAPGDYVVLVRNGEAFSSAFSDVPYVELPAWATLNNSGDVPTLLFDGEVIDAVPYETDWGESDVALERIDPAGPSGNGVNWAPSVDARGGTPGTRNSVHAPDDAPPQLVFVEQIADTLLLATFDEPLDSATVVPNVFEADGASPARVELLEDGETARLVFPEGVDAESLTAEELADLTGNAQPSASAPVALLAQLDEVIINELMFAPATDSVQGHPPAPEYVELLSRSDRLLSLRGLTLTSTAGSDTFVVTTAPASLAPGGFAVVFADPDASADAATDSRLARAFPDADFPSLPVALLPLRRSGMDLSSSGETVHVHRADGTALDAVPYDPDWHSPDLKETRGVALERIDPDGDAAAPTNWSSATVPEGGTPGQLNSIFVDVSAPPTDAGLRVEPSPFSPDGDGFDDFATLVYTLRAAPATVRVRIYNQTGRLVRTLTPATLGGATGRLTWDGRDDDGRRLRMGIYVVILDAVAAEQGRTEAYKAPLVLARKL